MHHPFRSTGKLCPTRVLSPAICSRRIKLNICDVGLSSSSPCWNRLPAYYYAERAHVSEMPLGARYRDALIHFHNSMKIIHPLLRHLRRRGISFAGSSEL